MDIFFVQPFDAGKIENRVAERGQETLMVAAVVPPKRGGGMEAGERRDELGYGYGEDTPMYHFDILRGFSTKREVTGGGEVEEPADADDDGASQEEEEFGELEELVGRGGEGEREEDGQEIEGPGDDGLHIILVYRIPYNVLRIVERKELSLMEYM